MRVQGVSVSGHLIGDIAKSSNRIPHSAKFRNAYFDCERNVFVCLFEDDSFENVPEGSRFPIDVPVITQ